VADKINERQLRQQDMYMKLDTLRAAVAADGDITDNSVILAEIGGMAESLANYFKPDPDKPDEKQNLSLLAIEQDFDKMVSVFKAACDEEVLVHALTEGNTPDIVVDKPADDVMAICSIQRQAVGIMLASTRTFVERNINGGVPNDSDGNQD
jgi:hypothetical protein